MSGDAEDPPKSFSSLRARFEQLATSPAAAPPKPTPKPAGLARPPAAPKPAQLAQKRQDKDAAGNEPESSGVGESASVELREVQNGITGVADSGPKPHTATLSRRPNSSDESSEIEGGEEGVDPFAEDASRADERADASTPDPDPPALSSAEMRTDVAGESQINRLEISRSPGSIRRPPPPRPAAPAAARISQDAVAEAPNLERQDQLPAAKATEEVPTANTATISSASPATSVRSLVSRFARAPDMIGMRSNSAPALNVETHLRPRSDLPAQGSRSAPMSPFETGDNSSDEGYSSDSTYHSSSDDEGPDRDEKPMDAVGRPVIPPRPAIHEQPPTPAPVNITIPALPTRSLQPASPLSTTSSPTTSSMLDDQALSVPFTRSPSNSISVSSDAPAILPPIPARPLPAAREQQATSFPPISIPGGAPALPARSHPAPAVPLPPRPAMSAPPAPDFPAIGAAPTAYVPPPPPMRTVAAAEKLPPKRPSMQNGSGAGDGSSEGEDDATPGQEFPDATFANRRPPTHRSRRPVHTTNQFSAWTVRGSRVVTAHHRLHLWYSSSSGVTSQSIPICNDQQKFLSVAWRAADADRPEDEGRYLWCGTKEGHLFEVDVEQLVVTETRQHAHGYPITSIYRHGRSMITVDESGKLLVWAEKGGLAGSLAVAATAQQRLPAQQTWTSMLGDDLWTSSGPTSKPGSTAVSMRSPQIRVFDPTGSRGGAFSLLNRPLVTPESAGYVGGVSASAIVPEQDHLVFLGHDNGFISVWERSTYNCVQVQRVAAGCVSALVGVRNSLWAGFRTGYVHVYDVSAEPWVVLKAWKAHEDPVIRMMVDATSLWQDATLQVASASNESVCLWDGFMREDWIDAELHLRQPDYCTFRSIRALCVTWNVDSNRPTDLQGSVDNLEFLRNVVTSVDSPDIISFGFQEMIDLEDKKLTAKSMLIGKKKAVDGKMSDSLSAAYRQWHDKLVQAVRMHLPADTPYTVVHVGDMIGLFSCIFVKTSEATRLRDSALVTVKTGMGGRYGNKGAILSRFVIDDSSLCFINCHLAAGQSHRRQRDRDVADILESKASFSQLASSSPGAYAPGGAGTMVFDHELTIFSGDLNYRIDARRDAVVSAVASGNAESLLQHDQLLKNLANNQSFRLRSFKEAPIHFPPTYKYDPGTDQYDSSPKRRIPAWCDRILWRADRGDDVTPLHYQRYEVNVSDHKPVSAAFDIRIKCIDSNKRATVWQEVESAWFSVESSILESARRYYGEK